MASTREQIIAMASTREQIIAMASTREPIIVSFVHSDLRSLFITT